MRVNKLFNVDIEHAIQLEEHAKQTNLSKSAIVRQSITQFFHNLNQEKTKEAAKQVCDKLFGETSGGAGHGK